MKELYIHSDCGCDRYYKVAADTLKDAQDIIIRYEEFVYDLYASCDPEDDTWGWWLYGKYEIVNYEDIEDGAEINDLVDYVFDYSNETFCKTFKKEEKK